MTAIFVGIIFIVVGAWGLIHWFGDFLAFVRGMVPVSFFLGGLMAFVAGVATLRASRRDNAKKN